MTDVRARIIELFEKHRQTPGAPYDESHFLDFLLAKPKKKRAVYNSFRGLRRYNAFIDEVQYELAVCFSNKDRDSLLSLDKFVACVIERRKSPRGSKMALKFQSDDRADWGFLALADFLLFAIVVISLHHPVAFAIAGGIATAFNLGFLFLMWRKRRYFRKLQARLEEA
jgi:hypothetical protein